MAENNLQGATAKKIKEGHMPNQKDISQTPKTDLKKKNQKPGAKGNHGGGEADGNATKE